MLTQIYGQFSSQNSNAIVSRGIACALARHGLDVQVYDPAGVYNGLWEDLPTGISPGAEVGIFVGYPPESIQFLTGHDIRVGCFIAESSIIPAEWGAIAAACDLVCVPSRWNAEAFIRGGVSPQKLLVMPHGLNPVYAKQSRLRRPSLGGAEPRFLHIAGAPAFRERKGTGRLIKAFGKLVKERPSAELTLRCGLTDPALLSAIKQAGVTEQVTIIEEGPLEPQKMRHFLCSGYDALVLPSRAEAFGLLGLEARAVGLPVILTHCSGHLQHAEEWDTVIAHGPDAMIKVNGIPNGAAPTVKASSILNAMEEYIANRHSRWVWASKGASGYFNNNSWGKVSKPLAHWLRARRRRISRPGLHI